ncbi:MAG: NAD(P)/FAD-dependent oxidoreductase, partial [Gammaproteobacteria bacterium]
GRRRMAAITLVDARETHLWKPLLHEVAAGTMNAYGDELSYLALAKWNDFRFCLGEMAGLDRRRHEIELAPLQDEHGSEYVAQRRVGYDSLVLAVGSVTNDFGLPGVAEHCFALDTREQADKFHKRVLRACFAANLQPGAPRDGQLHIAIAGAGATGVELAAELCDLREALAEHEMERGDPVQEISISVIEGAPRILPGLPERMADATREVLSRLRIAVITGERIASATADAFEIEGGPRITSELKVWAAGIRGASWLATLDGLEVNRRGQLVVDRYLHTTRDEQIYAFGDCAACALGSHGELAPPRAQVAHQQAATLARTLRAQVARGGGPFEFEYNDLGSLVNLSRYETVGKLMGKIFGKATGSLFIEGLLARWAYRSLYKAHRAALLGWWRASAETLANLVGRRARARVKLH